MEDIQRDILLIITTSLFIFLSTGFTVTPTDQAEPIVIPPA